MTVSKTVFDLFLRTHAPRLYSLAFHLGGDSVSAERITQEAFLRAYRQWNRVKNEQELGAALSSFVVRAWRRYEATRKAESSDSQASPNVRSVLSTLSLDGRGAVILRDVEHCTPRETAQLLGVSVEKVESLLANARESLCERLGELNGGRP